MTTALRLSGKGHAAPGKKCHHLHEHKISCAEYEHYRERASGHCEICGVSEELVYRKLLHLDHCHMTGRIRGMLCGKCNIMMACYDGDRTWGANRVWEPEAARYVELSLMWDTYRQITKRIGSDWATEIYNHIRASVNAHGNEHERTELAAAEQELAERRARKGGRPKKATERPVSSEEKTG